MKKGLAIALAVMMAIGIAGCAQEQPEIETFAQVTPEPTPTPAPTPEPTYVPPTDVSPTTGLPNTTTEYRPVVVQIDNEPAARPQEGLQIADVVYETLIEDVATRFTCVYNDVIYSSGVDAAAGTGGEDTGAELEDAEDAVSEEVQDRIVVGPVRSSRYYHQWIASEWDPLYVHVGGPDTTGNAESNIWGESDEYIHERINGAGKHAVNTNMFFKNKNGAPLDAFAMTDLVADSELYNFAPVQRPSFKFYPEEAYTDEPEIEKVELSFLSKPGLVEYKYDAEKDKLVRYMNGKEFITDETGEAVEVQNLIIQYTYVGGMPNDAPRRKVDMFGSGDAEFFIHGKHMKGTWERADASVPTVFYLENGEEVTLAPGNTWIAVHPNDKQVITTYADGTESITNGAEQTED